MKKLLSAVVAVFALSAGFPNTSIAESASSEAGVEATLAELQHRIEQLEARVGGQTLTAFRGRIPAARHVTQSAASSKSE